MITIEEEKENQTIHTTKHTFFINNAPFGAVKDGSLYAPIRSALKLSFRVDLNAYIPLLDFGLFHKFNIS